MKKNLVPILLVLCLIAASVIVPLTTSATEPETIINNAYDDFSSTNNPNGVWSYESRVLNELTGEYDYTPYTYASDAWGTEEKGTLALKDSCMETSKPAIRVIASNDLVTETVLTYTAPESGTVQVSMKNGGVFSTTRNSKGLIRFSMIHNSVIKTSVDDLDSNYNKNNPFFDDSITLIIKKGDIIRFVVGKNNTTTGKIFTDFCPEINYAKIEKEKPKQYSAADEFTLLTMEDQWRYYGYNPSNGQFAPLAANATSWGVGGNCSVNVGTDCVTGKKTMSLHSGLSLDPTLAFVAPYTGKINISMKNGGIYAPKSGYDGVIFTFRINDSIISTEKINSVNNYEGHRIFSDTKELSVTAGDILYFSFNKNANTSGDSIYFDPYIEYTETVGEYDSTLRFLDDDTITCSNLFKDSFSVAWPSARGGVGEYTYTVYTSKTPFTGVPAEKGIEVGSNRAYTLTGLESGTAYYVGIVATDGVSKVLLTNENPTNTISKLFVFNGYDDFKTVNMVSPWSYEVKPSGQSEYKALAWDGASGFWGDKKSSGYITTATTDLVTGKPAVLLEPYAGSTLSITFTAPYTGKLSVAIGNGGIMVPYNGAGNKWDGINFALLQNGKTLCAYDGVNASNCHESSVGAMYKGRLFKEKMELEVKAGDVLRFTVNPNEAFGNDKTYINPEIIYSEVKEGSLDLHFEDSMSISGSDITDTKMTVSIPSAFGGTGNYQYTLYKSDKPITEIPAVGGIDLAGETSYTFDALTPYTNYYFAAKVFDGKDTATVILTGPIATIGNTYSFDALSDWFDGGQPIDTPWRYYLQSLSNGNLTLMNWDATKKCFAGDKNSPSANVSPNKKEPVTGATTLSVHPDANYNTVIAFTAPFSGKVSLDTANGGVFTPFNGAAQGNDGINFSVLCNGQTLYSKNNVCGKNNHNDRCFSNAVELTVKRGDVIYFTVNKSANVNADTTFYNPRVKFTYVEKGSDTFAFWPDATISNSDVTKTSFRLSWSTAMGASGAAKQYSVWLSKTPVKSKPATAPVYTGAENSCNCTGLSLGTRYYAYVEAVDSLGARAVLTTDDFVKTESPVYNAFNDYNTKNGAGIWNYAIRCKDMKTGAPYYQLLKCEDGVYGTSASGAIHTNPSDLVVGKNVINMHPGSKGQAPTLVFTAPYSGEISISMINGGVFCPNNGKEQDYDGIAFIVMKNSTEVMRLDCVSSLNNPVKDRLFTEPITVTVKQGDKIYFTVDPNKSNAGDSTYFCPQIEYLNITGGTGKITSLTGFTESSEDENENQNDLTTVHFRENKTSDAKSASAYTVPIEEDNTEKYIVMYSLIGGILLCIVLCVVSFILKKKKIK